MEFSQLYFLFLFLPLFFLCYYLVGKTTGNRGKNIVLLIFSLLFYAWGEPVYVLLMVYSTLLDYVCGQMIEKNAKAGRKNRKKAWLAVSLVGNLGLLGVFKYLDFLIETLNLLPSLNLPLANLMLPIGISFYTFQTMSYSIDVYRGEIAAQKNILTFGAYLTMFPQLIAGPVVRYKTVEEELLYRKESMREFADGLRRFVIGLSKKVLIANTMVFVADGLYHPLNPTASVATEVSHLGALGAWVVMLAYTLHIYFDFSGYSDMAIGLGKMMGFHFLENFNYPYISKSITEFWRRWHISMSSFFRDYVYFPLGGSRTSRWKWVRNILVVWFLTGLWHGAEWNFVLWGLYFAAILLLEKLLLGKYLAKLPVLNRVYTLLMIVFGWVIFRAGNLAQIGEFFKTMLGGYGFLGNGTKNAFTLLSQAGLGTVSLCVFLVGVVAATPILPYLKSKWQNSKAAAILADVAILLLFTLCVAELAIGSYNPFIYFKF